jgi:hypothetical protein
MLSMRLERRLGPAYIAVCVVISLSGWLPFVFWRPINHGGTLLDITFMWSGLVIGAYCTIELIRATTKWWLITVLVIWLVPYVAAIGVGLYAAAYYVVAYFAT